MMATKAVGKVPTNTDKRLANLRKGGGRPKGVPNKNTKALKEMILGALDGAGGQDYLQRQAEVNPTAFLSLIGKVLPTELKGNLEGNLIVNVVTGVPRE
jgi:hypothetical protein